MPDDHAASTAATETDTAGRHADAESASGSAQAESPSLVDHLLADIRDLKERDSALHQRLLEQMERRHAAEVALHAERFKVAALQRDLELVQLRLRSVHANVDQVPQECNVQARPLRDIRASLMRRIGKTYRSGLRKFSGRLREAWPSS